MKEVLKIHQWDSELLILERKEFLSYDDDAIVIKVSEVGAVIEQLQAYVEGNR